MYTETTLDPRRQRAVPCDLWSIQRPYITFDDHDYIDDNLSALDAYIRERWFTYPMRVNFILDGKSSEWLDADTAFDKVIYYDNDAWAVTTKNRLFDSEELALEYFCKNVLTSYEHVFRAIVEGTDKRLLQAQMALTFLSKVT